MKSELIELSDKLSSIRVGTDCDLQLVECLTAAIKLARSMDNTITVLEKRVKELEDSLLDFRKIR